LPAAGVVGRALLVVDDHDAPSRSELRRVHPPAPAVPAPLPPHLPCGGAVARRELRRRPARLSYTAARRYASTARTPRCPSAPCRSSLPRIELTWVSTVRSVSQSCLAMPAFVRPSAIKPSTSRSRGVSSSSVSSPADENRICFKDY